MDYTEVVHIETSGCYSSVQIVIVIAHLGIIEFSESDCTAL